MAMDKSQITASMHPFPDGISLESLGLVSQALRGNFPDLDQVNHAAWELYGFASAQLSAGTSAQTFKSLPTDSQAADALDALAQVKQGGGDSSEAQRALGLDLPTLLPILLDLLMKIIARKMGGE